MCSVELRDFSEGVIRPHENTHGKYKEDRLQILKQTQCNLSHIFGMVKDPEGFLESLYEAWMYQAPLIKVVSDDSVEHVVWKIEHTRAANLPHFFAEKSIYIVDGHHRYESALAYARSVGALGNKNHPASQMLFAIANVYDPALVVLPTHRKVSPVEWKNIDREALEAEYELVPTNIEAIQKFTSKPHNEPTFGLFAWGGLFQCTPRHWHKEQGMLGEACARLAVTWSDSKLLKDHFKIEESERAHKITYEKNLSTLWDNKTQFDLIVFHAPPAIEAITNIADEKGYLPQKSTYFYPKLAAGLTLRDVSK
jgi:uncharacterized protein (DUF1015 family)